MDLTLFESLKQFWKLSQLIFLCIARMVDGGQNVNANEIPQLQGCIRRASPSTAVPCFLALVALAHHSVLLCFNGSQHCRQYLHTYN